MSTTELGAISEAREEPGVAPFADEDRFDVERIREDFPGLGQIIHGKPLVYLDNAASAQKPQAVIDAVAHAYTYDYSNVHRGVHTLSQRATEAYEQAREEARRFLGAEKREEVVFLRGTTEGINLVAQSFVRPRLQPGDEIVLSTMEHHSNIVPWQMLCQETGAVLKIAPIDDRGDLDLEAYEALLGERTRIVSMVHYSNSLGTINPVRQIVERARARGIPTLLDGAQAAPHGRIDVQDLGCDFYTLSGHKLFGPTGIGVLWGRESHLRSMVPYQGGGDMILSVTFEHTEYNEPPHRFEAGTPNIVGAIGLAAAMRYVSALDPEQVRAHEQSLLRYATRRLQEIPGLRIIGTAREKTSVVSFLLDGVHAHDVGTILDQEGVAVRVGHHCTQPLMERFGVASTARASFAFYNTHQEVDRLVEGLGQVVEIFSE